MLTKSKPADAKRLIEQAQTDVKSKWHLLEQMAALRYGNGAAATATAADGETAKAE
jgi:hypothetical protein